MTRSVNPPNDLRPLLRQTLLCIEVHLAISAVRSTLTYHPGPKLAESASILPQEKVGIS